MIVRPQCPDQRCHHVSYDVVRREDLNRSAGFVLGAWSPFVTFTAFDSLCLRRKTLKQELEVVMRIPGVEYLLETRQTRKGMRVAHDETDAGSAGMYLEQDDGEA